MSARLKDRRWRTMAFLGVAIYAVFLMTAAFEHHDLLCHLKTPQHCTACSASLVGADPHPPAIFGTWHLADAGRASSFQPPVESTLLGTRSSGRSPPAAA